MKENKKNGFSPEKEKDYLSRLNVEKREKSLSQELKTQLAEDFGMIEFTKKYYFNNEGKIVDLVSGEEIIELTKRGGNDQEFESIRKIEEGLRDNPSQIWISFSPKNEKFGYVQKYIDMWRVLGKKVVWNRLSVKNDFQQMNQVRHLLSGEEKAKNEIEILGLPIATEGLQIT